MLLNLDDIKAAATRINDYINLTPLLVSHQLNQWLSDQVNHHFFFKAENLQKVGAFKARGAFNTLSYLKQNQQLPKRIVTYSSGNHAQAVAWSAKHFNTSATIFMTKDVSSIKYQACVNYGSEVILCDTRLAAEQQAKAMSEQGAYLIAPFDNDQVICGQGTCTLEALQQHSDIDAIFCPCSGGGLLAGSIIAAKGINPKIKVFGVEPQNAEKSQRSLKLNHLVRHDQQPDTIADGARALGLSERTFHYIKQVDDMFTVSEYACIYWTQWLTHLLKVTVEPTSALAMAAAASWIGDQTHSKNILILLSGGNIDHRSRQIIWEEDLLNQTP